VADQRFSVLCARAPNPQDTPNSWKFPMTQIHTSSVSFKVHPLPYTMINPHNPGQKQRAREPCLPGTCSTLKKVSWIRF
jgi:hypothetical protein